MNWFKSIWLTSEERAILKEAKRKKELENQGVIVKQFTEQEVAARFSQILEDQKPKRPYRKIIYDGVTIQVIFNDGSVYSKGGVDGTLFKQVRDAITEEDIYILLIDKVVTPISAQVETPEEKAEVMKESYIFDSHPDFERVNNDIFLKGVSLALPSVVAITFMEILEKMDALAYGDAELPNLQENYHALKMFWLKLALNPLPQSREDLLLFVKKNDVRITKNGNLVLYRRIVSRKGADNNLTAFVSQNYANRKRQKKSSTNPKNYCVYDVLGTLTLVKNGTKRPKNSKNLGNLEKLYKNLPEQEGNTYTSAHNKGKMEIKIGGIYNIPDTEINLNNGLCAAGGLHAAAVDYDYSGFGDVPVVVLVNPSKAITVPTTEWKKLRTTEMFIAAINDKPHGQHFDDGALSIFDDEYHDLTLGELEKAVEGKTFNNISIQDNVPIVNLVDLNTIKNMLKDRVKPIV